MINTGSGGDPAAAESTGAGNPPKVRAGMLAIAAVAVVTAVVVGLLVVGLSPRKPAHAATPAPLTITARSAGAPVTLGALARAALADTSNAAGTVDHLVTERWDLHSVIDGQNVTSAVFPSRRELWRTSDNQARTVDSHLPAQFRGDDDRNLFGDTNTPGSFPERTDYPAGTFTAAFDRRPPTDPEELASWLARSSPSDIAILNGVTDLLQERALTGPERAAVLAVLDIHTPLAYAGTSTDRAGRPGAAFTLDSAAAGGQSTYMLLLEPDTGRFLAYEQILTAGASALKVNYPAVISYRTYLQAESVATIP